MVVLTTTLLAKPGREQELEKAIRALAAVVAEREAGCLLYQPARSQHESARFLILERYRDGAALTAHANAVHFQDAMPGLMELLVSPPELAMFDELGDWDSGSEENG